MDFDYKAILKSDNIKKINGSVEKIYRRKIECCDEILSYCMIINQLQIDIKNLNMKNQHILDNYFKNNGTMNNTDSDIIKQVNILIAHKKKLRNYYSDKMKELKDIYDI